MSVNQAVHCPVCNSADMERIVTVLLLTGRIHYYHCATCRKVMMLCQNNEGWLVSNETKPQPDPEPITARDIRALLDPAKPNTVWERQPGVWIAYWRTPDVPELHRMVVEHHDQLEIVRGWYEPENLPGWRAVEFTVNAPFVPLGER